MLNRESGAAVQEIWGRETYSELREIVDSQHTALILVDLQNDFCHPDGHDAQGGADLGLISSVLPRIDALLTAARDAGIFVVWVTQSLEPDARADSPAWLRRRTRAGSLTPEWTLKGSWGEQIIERFQPAPGEVVVSKHRSSAFIGTSLDLILRSNEIRSTVIAGVMTQGCVESTARDATFMDYYVVLARDCVASVNEVLHEASLICQSTRYDIVTSDAITGCWAPVRDEASANGSMR
jgi:ureidoacrylate peracid hydrolase